MLSSTTLPRLASRATRRAPDWLTPLAFAGIVVFLGLNFVVVRFSNRELAPLWGAGLRFALASVLLLAAVAALKLPLPRGRSLLGALAYGSLSFGVTYAFVYTGMVYVPASMAAIIFAALPLVTLLLAAPLGMERLSPRRGAAAILVLVGMATAFGDQIQANVPLTALVAVLVGVLCTAAANLLLKRLPQSHPVSVTAIGMPIGAALLLGASVLGGEQPGWPMLGATWMALAWLVVSSIGGFVLMVWVLARWSASATSYAAVLTPLLAAVSATMLAGEPLSPGFLAGGVLVVTGVATSVVRTAQQIQVKM